MNKNLIAPAKVSSSYLWLACVIVFITVILLSTKGFSKDPSYSPGGSEEVFLLPMLGSFFLGCLSFGLMVLSGIKWRIVFIGFSIIAVFIAFFVGSARSNLVMYGNGYTGEELFSQVNKHRLSIGVNPVKLGEKLCDNLVSRWKVVKEGQQHEGFEKWVIGEEVQKVYKGQIVELYVSGPPSPAEAVAFWTGSPGHKLELENPRWTDGCVYTNEGISVLVMSYK